MTKTALITALIVLAGVLASGGLNAAELKRIGLDRSGQTTHVVFEFDRAPSIEHFVLGSPPRAVIDMAQTRDAWHGNDLSGPNIKSVRLARHKNGVLRTVLDLRASAYWAGVKKQGPKTIVASIKSRLSQSAHAGADSSAAESNSRQATYHVAPRREPAMVVIDPGHGGHDPGTTGPHGLQEKTVTLAIGRRVAKKLSRRSDIKARLTRDSDRYLSLPARRRVTQRHKANLFISIHANAYPRNPAVDGGSCYVLSKHGASDAKARQLAHFENSSDPQVAGVRFSATNKTLNAVLTDLFQNDSINAADNLAKAIITEFGRVEPLYHGKPLRANFSVLRDPMIPSVLCETAFLSNPRQARKLHHARFRDQLAGAIAKGVINYFQRYPPMQKSAHGATVYLVKSGDSLSAIAATHGTSVKRLIQINHLKDKTLSVGQRLLLRQQTAARPPTAVSKPARYTVQAGDTLSVIAARRGTTVKRLQRLNGLSGTVLKRGQTLKVPRNREDHRIVVDAGDTLSQIARHNDTSIERIKRYNNLDSDQLAKGQVLWLPGNSSRSS